MDLTLKSPISFLQGTCFMSTSSFNRRAFNQPPTLTLEITFLSVSQVLRNKLHSPEQNSPDSQFLILAGLKIY